LGGFNRRTTRVSGAAAPKVKSLADVLTLINLVIADVWLFENSERRARLLLAAADSATKLLATQAFEKSSDWRAIAERHGIDPNAVSALVSEFRKLQNGKDYPHDNDN
jgi:hypothetical protein